MEFCRDQSRLLHIWYFRFSARSGLWLVGRPLWRPDRGHPVDCGLWHHLCHGRPEPGLDSGFLPCLVSRRAGRHWLYSRDLEPGGQYVVFLQSRPRTRDSSAWHQPVSPRRSACRCLVHRSVRLARHVPCRCIVTIAHCCPSCVSLVPGAEARRSAGRSDGGWSAARHDPRPIAS